MIFFFLMGWGLTQEEWQEVRQAHSCRGQATCRRGEDRQIMITLLMTPPCFDLIQKWGRWVGLMDSATVSLCLQGIGPHRQNKTVTSPTCDLYVSWSSLIYNHGDYLVD